MSKKQEIKQYANCHLYSDIEPYEVVNIISEKTVEVRLMETVQTKFPQDVKIAGYPPHTLDNNNQEYTYISNPKETNIRIRWSDKKKGWYNKGSLFIMSDKPIKFYDYNF